MAQVPAMEGAFVRVPKIATGQDTIDESDAAATTSSSSSSSNGSGAASNASSEELASLAALDIRVGRILSCERHPDADSLYVEKVECGDPDGPRTIVSGLVKYGECWGDQIYELLSAVGRLDSEKRCQEIRKGG